MAESTAGPKSRELFTELGNSWLKLAVEFENAKDLVSQKSKASFSRAVPHR
jgi:hypothetical protein